MDRQIPTNGCENFWSLLKRGINRTYVSVEPHDLFRYVDEQVYRLSHRKENDCRAVRWSAFPNRWSHANMGIVDDSFPRRRSRERDCVEAAGEEAKRFLSALTGLSRVPKTEPAKLIKRKKKTTHGRKAKNEGCPKPLKRT